VTSAENNAIFATCTVTAIIVPLESVGLNKAMTLTVGEVKYISGTYEPANATNMAFSWRSDNASIASVVPGTWGSSDGHLSCAILAVSPGTTTIIATNEEDRTIIATCAVTVVDNGSIELTDAPKALFTGGTASLQARILGVASWNDDVAWQTSHGSISPSGSSSGSRRAIYYAPATAPPGNGMATITVTNTNKPALSSQVQVQIQIRSLDFLKFDGNSKASPQLLDLANAFGSTSRADLDKYDINGDGVIDDEDLGMLFKGMGW
jgi:uncharacterized protein YjdB